MDGVGSKFDWTTKSRVISDTAENEVSFSFLKRKIITIIRLERRKKETEIKLEDSPLNFY